MRYQQPQSPTLLDASNPIASRVIGGCVPDVFSLRNGGASSVKSLGLNPWGVGSAGGSGNYATAAAAEVLKGRAAGASASNRDITFVFAGTVTSNNTIWFYDGQSDGVSSWWFKTDASGNLSASYGQSSNIAGTVPIPTGFVVLICHGGTNGGQVARTWVNGVEYAGTAATDSWPDSPAFTGMFGSSAFPTSNTFSGVGNLAVALRGNITSAEAKGLTNNLWQLFEDADEDAIFLAPLAGGSSYSDLAIQDASHAHAADSLTLATQSTLAIADATHAHAADSLTLTTLSVLSIADSSHGHAADNLTLAGSSAADLAIQDATHAHSSDSPVLVAQSFLAIADASHAHAADNLTLSTGLVVDLTIQDSTHAHTSDTPALAAQSFLSILDASHGHTADSLTLTTLLVLSIADSSHGHATDNLTLGVPVGLAIVDADHSHTADNLALSIAELTLNAADIAAIVDAIWARAATTPLPVDVRRMNSATVYGDGTPANKWRGYV